MTKKSSVSNVEKMFRESPIWKILIKLALPSAVMMLAMGSYFFFDNVLAINFAGRVYEGPQYTIPGVNGSTLVRLFMNGFSPINSLMIAMALLFGSGTAIRTAINLGKGDRARAERTVRTGFVFGMILAFIATPIIILAAKSWIESQYSSMDARSIKIIGDNAFTFAWPVILSFPMIMFNNIIPSLLRNEARMKQMMVALIVPIFINLLLDWIFMGPLNLGVPGGAWATFTANGITSLILVGWIFTSKKGSMLKWKILIGKNFKFLAIIGIIFVGVSPFLRNIAQSITTSVQTKIINDVSGHVFDKDYLKYWSGLSHGEIQALLADKTSGFLALLKAQSPIQWAQLWHGMGFTTEPTISDLATKIVSFIPDPSKGGIAGWVKPGTGGPELAAYLFMHSIINTQSASSMISIMSGTMPVFILFFPMMFAFVQAASPLASYNYGAKLFHRVRQVYWWTVIYAAMSAVIIYFLVAWGIAPYLIKLLKISDVKLGNTTIIASADLSSQTLKIIMLAMIAYTFGIAAMVIFSSTDRILFSMIASSLQGLILIWAVIYPFKYLAIADPDYKLLFFWYLPVLSAITSIVATLMVIRALYLINKKHQFTLDERIDFFYDMNKFYKDRTKALLKARKNGNYQEVKALWKEKTHNLKQERKMAKIKAQEKIEQDYQVYKKAKLAKRPEK